MEQFFPLFEVLARITWSLCTLCVLSIVIACLLVFLGVIVKSFEPEPWEK
jgi:hypothetical protein